MPETIIPNKVWRAVKEGPVQGVVPVIDRTPTGDQVVRLAPPSIQRVTGRGAPIKDKDGQVIGHRANVKWTAKAEAPSNLTFTGPAEIRRTARERYQELLRRLWSDANLTFYKDGEIRWPKSIQDEIAVLGIAQGKPDLAQQVEALARHFIVKGAREQQAHDYKKVALDWHGHLSA